MEKSLLVLGTPGVGKSRLSYSLGQKLGIGVIDLGPLVREKKLYKRFDPRTGSYIIDSRRVRAFLKNELDTKAIVLATHHVNSLIPSRRVGLAIVLRLDPMILYRRLRRRGWTRSKIWENVEAELIDVCLEEAVRILGRNKVFEIDATHLSPEKVFAKALAAVNFKNKAGRFRVDWLSVYDPLDLEKRFGWRSST